MTDLHIGDYVVTQYGNGYVEQIRRRDNIVLVRPETWMLDRHHIPLFYMNPQAVKKAATRPALHIGDYVNTLYGTGFIEAIRRRDDMVIVRPDTWTLDRGKVPTFFMHKSAVMKRNRPDVYIGDRVQTLYGTGYVEDSRPQDRMLVVRPDRWTLDRNKVPTFFMNIDAVNKIRGHKSH